MVSLEDFVADSITQVVRAIVKANEAVAPLNAIVAPAAFHAGGEGEGRLRQRHTSLALSQFAVTATDGTTTKGGVGVVAGILSLGAQGQTDAEKSSVSRIKFSIPVRYPVTD